MGLYNFQQQFVPYILDGSKRHTIRGERKYPDKAGNIMHLYTGLRRKEAILLMRVPCLKVEHISLEINKEYISSDWTLWIRINGILLDQQETDAFLYRDGFRATWDNAPWKWNPQEKRSIREALGFWRGSLPFSGHIYYWDFEKRDVLDGVTNQSHRRFRPSAPPRQSAGREGVR